MSLLPVYDPKEQPFPVVKSFAFHLLLLPLLLLWSAPTKNFEFILGNGFIILLGNISSDS